MANTLGMLFNAAGVIPRVLQGLFGGLGIRSTKNSVKVPFVEIYNKELHDLIATETTTKLKIHDNITKKEHATTVVQGMEEKQIGNAIEVIKVLQGSLKRQVAATKRSDLKSRSHTVFTIAAYVRRTAEES